MSPDEIGPSEPRTTRSPDLGGVDRWAVDDWHTFWLSKKSSPKSNLAAGVDEGLGREDR